MEQTDTEKKPVTKNKSIISIRNLSKKYLSLRRKIVLDDVSLNVSGGECVCIVGENGAGKSTLLKILLGIVPKNTGNISKPRNIG